MREKWAEPEAYIILFNLLKHEEEEEGILENGRGSREKEKNTPALEVPKQCSSRYAYTCAQW
jgi:hypothetical protein